MTSPREVAYTGLIGQIILLANKRRDHSAKATGNLFGVHAVMPRDEQDPEVIDMVEDLMLKVVQAWVEHEKECLAAQGSEDPEGHRMAASFVMGFYAGRAFEEFAVQELYRMGELAWQQKTD